MAIKFPDSPTQGDTHVSDNGVVYTFENGGWTANPQNITNLNGGQLAGFRNQLINGDFRVWQRDINFYSLTNVDRQYTSDRWQFFSANNDTSAGFNVNRDDDAPRSLTHSARITNAGSSNASGYGSAIFEQKIEDLRKFSNSTWTVSCYVKAGSTQSTYFNLQALGNYGSGGSPSPQDDFGVKAFYSNNGDLNSTSWTRVSFTFTVPDITGKTYGTDADNYLRVGMFGIGLEGSQNIKVAGFQLEPGPVATPFEHRPIGTELALAQRYYQRVSTQGIIGNYNSSSASTIFTVPGTAMRTKATTQPSIQISTGRYLSSGGTSVAITSVATEENGFRILIPRGDSTNSFSPVTLCNSSMAFDAEL